MSNPESHVEPEGTQPAAAASPVPNQWIAGRLSLIEHARREIAAGQAAADLLASIAVGSVRLRFTPAQSQAEKEIDRLADFIMQRFPGEPGRTGVSESAVDVAIRLMTLAIEGGKVLEALVHDEEHVVCSWHPDDTPDTFIAARKFVEANDVAVVFP